MPGFIGFPEILLLGLLALVLFGPKRLPEMGRGLGKGMREFKDSISGDKKEDNVFDTSQLSSTSEETYAVQPHEVVTAEPHEIHAVDAAEVDNTGSSERVA